MKFGIVTQKAFDEVQAELDAAKEEAAKARAETKIEVARAVAAEKALSKAVEDLGAAREMISVRTAERDSLSGQIAEERRLRVIDANTIAKKDEALDSLRKRHAAEVDDLAAKHAKDVSEFEAVIDSEIRARTAAEEKVAAERKENARLAKDLQSAREEAARLAGERDRMEVAQRTIREEHEKALAAEVAAHAATRRMIAARG